jgi:DNA-3-methyladenine glycosylase I
MTDRSETRPTRRTRCAWPGDDPLYLQYHDAEWGVPLHDDRRLFEFLVLEGAQAGLSWITILKKRENYRKALYGFDPRRIAGCGPDEVERLLANPGIVRNRLKIASVLRNARVVLDLQREFGSFDAYLWRFVGGRPIQNRWETHRDVPAVTDESRALSRDLIRHGCSFVGPTICYAFMQAVGMVNDHLVRCYRHRQVAAAQA